MAGKKGRSGRRKSTVTLVMEALEKNDNFLLQYLEELREIAFDKNAPVRDRIQCLEYLINRSQGTPKAQTDLRIKEQTPTYNPDLIEAMRVRLLESLKRESVDGEAVELPLQIEVKQSE